MPQLKQKTISVGNQSQTIVLKKKKNTMGRGGKSMYTIEDKDTGALIEDPFTNKRKAKRAFERSVDDIQRGMESAKSSDSGAFGGGGGFGGGEPIIDTSTDSDDDLIGF